MSVKITTTPASPNRIVPLVKLHKTEGYEWTSLSSNRHMIFNSEDRIASNGDVIKGNGLKEIGAIIRFGKKILIDLNKFDEWIEQKRSLPEKRNSDSL